jgi:hypothetical protein
MKKLFCNLFSVTGFRRDALISLLRVSLLFVWAVVSGCAPQTAQVQSPSGHKCTIDLVRLCGTSTSSVDRVRGGPEIDRAELEQDSESTATLATPLVVGDNPVLLACDVNARTKKVIYGRLYTGKENSPVSEAQVAQLRMLGYCLEPSD